MKIIDKNKDYYDYLSGIYGTDERIAFDKRGSLILKEDGIQKYITDNELRYRDALILECGFVHYLFKIDDTDNKSGYNFHLFHKFIDEVHFSDKPLCIYFIREYDIISSYYYTGGWKQVHKLDMDRYSNIKLTESMIRGHHKPYSMELPILRNTFVPSIIRPEEIWQNLYNYLCKIREPKIVDTRDDIAKAIDHGFDKKTSFRHPVK
jgi:hypothetical protein